MESWNDLLVDGLLAVVQNNLEHSAPTPIQLAALKSIKAHDVDYIVKAKTGSGKTLALLLPILNHLLKGSAGDRTEGTKVVYVAPTRELAQQTYALLQDILARLKPHWITGCLLMGGAEGAGATMARKKEKERLRKGQTVVIGTPGRLLDHLESTTGWRRTGVQWLALDEADRLMDGGFGPKITRIMSLLGDRQEYSVVCCSATAGLEQFGLRSNAIVVAEGRSLSERPSGHPQNTDHNETHIVVPSQLKQEYVIVPTKHRLTALLGLIRGNHDGGGGGGGIVIFLSCRDSVDYHYALFKNRAVPDCPRLHPDNCFLLHGSLEPAQRRENLDGFTNSAARGGLAVLFCTDVAARGLNFPPSVQLIVQYDAPSDRLDYVHRAGRTARLSNGTIGIGRNVLVLHESEGAYPELLAAKHGLDDLTAINVAGLLAFLDKGWGLWQKRLVEAVKKSPELLRLAQRAYASSIRAYATHSADEKAIFHIKRLHLGHLAASFGLAEEHMQASASTGGKRKGGEKSASVANATKKARSGAVEDGKGSKAPRDVMDKKDTTAIRSNRAKSNGKKTACSEFSAF